MTSSPSTYPIKGIFYFFTNLSLIRRIICVLFLTLIVSILFLFLTFGFLLTLQANALINAGCPDWLAWTVSVIFCLLESVVLTIIFYLIVTPIWQDALFDDVLRLKGLGHVLEKRTISDVGCKGFFSGLTTAFVTIYTLILVQVIALLITLPLHIIPVIGTIIYCIVNGWVMTWGHKIHYHIEIKEWTVKQSLSFAWKNRRDYISFGFVAVALELIPIANFLFFWTNVVGAALWTADMIIEEQRSPSSDNDGRAGTSSSYQEADRMDGSTNNKYGSTDTI